MPKKSIIISAGGIGKRMGAVVPKQFLILQDEPILMHTIRQFHNFDKRIEIIVILPANQIEFWQALCKQYNFEIDHQLVKGGKERFHSVKNGLSHTSGDLIGVHDAVRPLVSIAVIESCFNAAYEHGAAIPVLNMTDSIREVDGTGSKAVDRNAYKLVQTPQCFRADLIKDAYATNYDASFTDDASVLEKIGVEIKLVDGNEENIKITRPVDLKIAAAILELKN